MPRPKGLGTESRANVFIVWICFFGVLLIGLFACFSYAKAQTVNHDAKVDLPAGKSYHRICELTEADNIEIINRRSPDAKVLRYEGEQAKLYTFMLQTGNRIDGRTSNFKWHLRGPFTAGHGGYSVKLPIPDKLYIVKHPKRQTVYPFFIVDGCVARFLFQFPHNLHLAIVKHMKASPA